MSKFNKVKRVAYSDNSGIIQSIIPVLKSVNFYIGHLTIISGAELNFAYQAYLHNYMSEENTLPMLSDHSRKNMQMLILIDKFYRLYS